MVDTSNWPNLLVCTVRTAYVDKHNRGRWLFSGSCPHIQWSVTTRCLIRVKEHVESSSDHGHVNPQSKSYFLLLLSERIRLIGWSWEQVIFKRKVIWSPVQVDRRAASSLSKHLPGATCHHLDCPHLLNHLLAPQIERKRNSTFPKQHNTTTFNQLLIWSS